MISCILADELGPLLLAMIEAGAERDELHDLVDDAVDEYYRYNIEAAHAYALTAAARGGA